MHKLDMLDEVVLGMMVKKILAGDGIITAIKLNEDSVFMEFAANILDQHYEIYGGESDTKIPLALIGRINKLLSEGKTAHDFIEYGRVLADTIIIDSRVGDSYFSFMIVDENLYILYNDERLIISGIEYEDLYNQFYMLSSAILEINDNSEEE